MRGSHDKLLNSAINRAVNANMEKREKVLEEALKEGYDGVDFMMKPSDPVDGFVMKETHVKWNGSPKDRAMDGAFDRYDFRYYDRERLLEMIDEERH